MSAKVEHDDKSFKYFIGYVDGDFIKPLRTVLPQMSEFVKYFDNFGKSMSFMSRDDNVSVKYNEIWNKIKELIDKILHSIYHVKYIKNQSKII